MEDIFIKHIKVNKARNLVDFEIPLSQDERKHLLITGKNGSGKTSLLLELRIFLNWIPIGQADAFQTTKEKIASLINQKDTINKSLIVKPVISEKTKVGEYNELGRIETSIRQSVEFLKTFGGTEIKFNNSQIVNPKFKDGDFITAFFEAKRNTELKMPTGINKIDIKPIYQIEEKAGNQFIQYIVNLKADRSFAKDDNDVEAVRKIDDWFEIFKENLLKLFDSPGMQLKFDRSNYNFNIIEDGKEPYNFNQLSAGYSAIFNIVSELIMRMEKNHIKSYDVQGVVLIDEIETHLHIDLQKKILPFLTAFFPRIQFIVTTHSPFVLSSVENAVICDLEKRIVTTDLSGYSYDALVESYFDSDKYSSILKERINEYEELLEKDDLTDDEKDNLFYLKRYINDIPKFASDEVAVKIQQLRLKELNKRAKNGLPT